ncbi:MAG: sigma-70 family RNA polymerase sigma factor [Planctomycetaceae bacterium]
MSKSERTSEETPTSHDSRISQIQTHWSLVLEAKQAQSGVHMAARGRLAMRYCRAIVRYLTVMIGNPEEAEDVAQDLMVRFLDGMLMNADPSRGRLRDYIKTIAINAARTYLKRKDAGRQKQVSTENAADVAAAEDVEWEACLRTDYLTTGMESLTAYERSTGKPYASLLEWRTANSFADSGEMARFLERRTGTSVSTSNARKLLQRAREKLAEGIVEEVRARLPENHRTAEEVQEQLAAVGLLEICSSVIRR